RVSGRVKRFALGSRDVSDRWVPSGAFIGRQREQRELLHAWRQASAREAVFVRLSGDAGIGKTALVAETLRQPAMAAAFYAGGRA
ncbi:AAA family ATPase, partial [Acinetobacter baumannii]